MLLDSLPTPKRGGAGPACSLAFPKARLAAPCLLALVLTACASASQDLRRYGEHVASGDGSRLACVAFLAEVQDRIEAADVRDAEASRIAGFPYLRINRFLSEVRPQGGESAAPKGHYQAWAERLLALENEALAIELGNLPGSARAELDGLAQAAGGPGADPLAEARRCGAALLAADLKDPARRAALLQKAKVPDHYSDFSRVFGFYPLMALPVMAGWNRWQEIHLPAFEAPAEALPVEGELHDFLPEETAPPLTASEVAALLAASRDPHFGVPRPSGPALQRLIATFAPVWRIDVTGSYDRVGHPVWPAGSDAASVDVTRPTVFTRISHTRLGGETLLQISYAAWFQERPSDGPLDLLAGKLDALIWRVTLGRDGKPVIYDTIHACGCYHLFFPAPETRLSLDDTQGELQEETAVPARAPALAPGERMVLRIESRSHYLKGLAVRPLGPGRSGDLTYAMAGEGRLRALELPGGGTRSLYRSDGIVAGTERLERFLLWPMGIASAGAMRQWGNHSTAFVGVRHFDDPDLYESMIEP